jgi:hypothetical protein
MRNTLAINNSWEAANKARRLSEDYEEWQNHSKSLRGRKTFEGFGRLPDEYHDACRTAHYWIYSYATPIAWYNENDSLVKPNIRYSVTTSKHQGRIW